MILHFDLAAKENGCLQVSLWKPLTKRSLDYQDVWQNNNAFAVTVRQETRLRFTKITVGGSHRPAPHCHSLFVDHSG